jgi:hypothetical protein
MAARQAGTATVASPHLGAPGHSVVSLAAPAAFLAVLTLTSCGSSSTGPANLITPSATPSPAASAEQAAVIAAYDAMWPAGAEAERAPAAQRQAILAPHLTGPELAVVLSGQARDDAKGQRSWGAPVPRPYDVVIHGENATLQDCQDDRHYGTSNLATGQRLTHGLPRVHVAAMLERGADGVWRVATLKVLNTPCLPVRCSPRWSWPPSPC